MRKLAFFLPAILLAGVAFSQAPVNKMKIGNRAGDHFMFQLAANFWTGTPDSVDSYIKNLNRSANAYVMIDKRFKGSPKLSAAIGIGVGTSNIYFKSMEVQIDAFSPKLPFVRTDTGNHFKKYKVSTAYLEAPIELRFTAKPETPNKSVKGAIGVKIGTLLNAHTKGKTLENSTGTKLNGFTEKESTRTFFNSTRVVATARVGYGIFTLFGAYNLNGVFKDGVAADMKLLQVGLSISGL